MVGYDERSPTCLVWLVNNGTRCRKGNPVKGASHNGYVRVQVGGVLSLAHRLIWEIHNGKIPPGYVVDHINRVRSDNRISNLRLVTPSQNCQNVLVYPGKTSGLPKGISMHQKGGYKARIRLNNVVHEKYHKTLEGAIEWRTLMERNLHTHRPN